VVIDVNHGPGGAPWPAVVALHSGTGVFGVRMTARATVPGPVPLGGPHAFGPSRYKKY